MVEKADTPVNQPDADLAKKAAKIEAAEKAQGETKDQRKERERVEKAAAAKKAEDIPKPVCDTCQKPVNSVGSLKKDGSRV